MVFMVVLVAKANFATLAMEMGCVMPVALQMLVNPVLDVHGQKGTARNRHENHRKLLVAEMEWHYYLRGQEDA